MLSVGKIDRINELARKSKSVGLSDIEKKEQQILRKEYLAGFRANFIQQLENIEFVDDVQEKVEKIEKGN